MSEVLDDWEIIHAVNKSQGHDTEREKINCIRKGCFLIAPYIGTE
jgi:hypothetical protein